MGEENKEFADRTIYWISVDMLETGQILRLAVYGGSLARDGVTPRDVAVGPAYAGWFVGEVVPANSRYR